MIEQIVASLIVAAITGLVTGSITGARMFGKIEAQVKANTRAVEAVHARLDAWMIAMAEQGNAPTGAVAHLARANERKVAHERRR